MSDYKFSCPNCEQHLSGTPAWAGRSLTCPTCQKEFTVPPPPVAVAPTAVPVARATATPARAPIRAADLPRRPGGAPGTAPAAAGPGAMPPPVAGAAAMDAGGANKPAKASMICGISAMAAGLLALPVTALIPILGAFIGLPLMLLAFVASIVGVVLGHKGRGRIKRGLTTLGGGQALAGLIMGYLGIVAGVLMLAAIVVGSIVGIKAVKAEMERNSRPSRSVPVAPDRNFPPGRNQPGGTDRNDPTRPPRANRQPRNNEAATARPTTNDPRVSTDPATATIPDSSVTGTLGGSPFKYDKAEFNTMMNLLTVQEGTGMMADKSIKIFFFPKDKAGLLGKTWTFVPGTEMGKPHVHYSGGGQGGAEMDNYALKVELGQPQGGKVKGKLYLELGQSKGTKLAGTFEAVVAK